MTKAQELLAAKARRVRLARRRVVAATLAAFVLAWGVVAFDGSMGTTTVGLDRDDEHRPPPTAARRPTPTTPTSSSVLIGRRRRHRPLTTQPVMTEHAFWITSRAAGIIALLAASVAVALGAADEHAAAAPTPRGRASCTRRSRWRRWWRWSSTPSRCSATATSRRRWPTSRSRSSAASGWGSGSSAAGCSVILGLSYYIRGRHRPGPLATLHRFTARRVGARRRARGGDVRFAGPERIVAVADPFGGAPLHRFRLGASAVATSGIGRRSWPAEDGRPAHHCSTPRPGARRSPASSRPPRSPRPRSRPNGAPRPRS